jgi:hypothetical protein
MIHTGISGSGELATIYQRRIKLSASNNRWGGISVWHNFNSDDQRTWGWFLHFQTVHQSQDVPELEPTNELATFLIVKAVDSDVEPESNPQKKEIGDGKNFSWRLLTVLKFGLLSLTAMLEVGWNLKAEAIAWTFGFEKDT